jgi:hypothetical protein
VGLWITFDAGLAWNRVFNLQFILQSSCNYPATPGGFGFSGFRRTAFKH